MTMVPRCNDNKAKLEDHQINLEGLEVHQTSQGVLRTKLVVHQTNLEVHKDNKVRQEDLQISLEDLEVHQTKLEARRTNLEAHQIKEGLLLKRWIPIQVILTTNQLRQKEKLPRKGNRLQKEKHLRRESRGLQMEQGLTNQFNLFLGFYRRTQVAPRQRQGVKFCAPVFFACLYIRGLF